MEACPLVRRYAVLVSAILLVAGGLPVGVAEDDGASPAWPAHPLAASLLAAGPLAAPGLIEDAIGPFGKGRPSEVHAWAAALSGRTLVAPVLHDEEPEWLIDVPADLRPALATLWAGKVTSEAHHARAFAAFSQAERAGLMDLLLAAEDARRDIARGQGTADQHAALAELRLASERIDQDALAMAGLTAFVAVERALDQLADADRSVGVASTCAGGTVVYEDASCRIVIGGAASNTYHADIDILVDLGGQDTYANNAGGSGGPTPGVAFALDLGGDDDVYETTLAPGEAAQGASSLGVGVLVDEGGDDTYLAHFSGSGALDRTWAQGTGVFGVALLWDRGGHDSYEARNIAQGAGLEGYGYLLDEGGADTYTIPYTFDSEGGQGTGCYGNVGALIDRGTHRDVYDAFIDDMQGFGCAGALGVLYDEGGDDTYLLQHGLGELAGATVEQSGWGQGYGEIGGAGILYDRGGMDTYTATGTGGNNGQQVQGVGVLAGVGVLLDLAGDDVYRARTLSQGVGTAGSMGLLYDGEGDDRYHADTACQGYGALGTGALIDRGGGTDTYTCQTTPLFGLRGDGQTWVAGATGLGMDR